MNDKLFIPKKIKVGFNERGDTYTKRLAYVIYYDEKGVLRKEKSWRQWVDQGESGRKRGKWNPTTCQYEVNNDYEPFPTPDFDNVPMDGFVLNKGAGGRAGSYSSWNIREPKIRVYDPRDFEIEISIPNLLFILTETNSYKGKGLEGQFVYAWLGTELVLLPTSAEEYKSSIQFTELQSEKVEAKSLIIGASYKTKKMEDVVYLGKYTYINFERYGFMNSRVKKNQLVFMNNNNKPVSLETKHLARLNDPTPIATYAEMLDSFLASPHYGNFDSYTVEDYDFMQEPDVPEIKSSYYRNNYPYNFTESHDAAFVKKTSKENVFQLFQIIAHWQHKDGRAYSSDTKAEFAGYTTYSSSELEMKKGEWVKRDLRREQSHISYHIPRERFFTKEEIAAMGLKVIKLQLSNGSTKILKSKENE